MEQPLLGQIDTLTENKKKFSVVKNDTHKIRGVAHGLQGTTNWFDRQLGV
jgi:hypothetical protein